MIRLSLTLLAVILTAATVPDPAAASLAAGPAAPVSSQPSFSQPTAITNAFAPFVPGAVNVYTGRTSGKDLLIVNLFLDETRTFVVGGVAVECVTVQETEFEGGRLAEISRNYFAQADDGVVYSFGEIADAYENGVVVDHSGSWLVGGPSGPSDPTDAAAVVAPTVLMPAAPSLGDTWKPDDLFPIADETALVLKTGASVAVRAGAFHDVMVVEERSDLEDAERERKWYAPGVGLVKSRAHGERMQLASTTLVPH